MLEDEEAINRINPFVQHEFSLPGGVRQTGDFTDFAVTREENGITDAEKSVYCDYGLCMDSKSECSLSKPLQPRRNIDTGFTKDRIKIVPQVVVGVANNPKMSIIGASILLLAISLILYYARRR